MKKGFDTSSDIIDSYEGVKVDPRYFKQESTDELKKPSGTELYQGEFGIADGLTVSDTSAIFQDKNKKVEPIKTPESDKPQVVKKILGAHLEVLKAKDRYNNNKLADITFVEGTSCGMSDAIAYIRYWTRTGTAQKNPVQSDTQFVLPDNVSEQLSKQLSELYGNSTKLSSLYTTDFDPNSIQYSPLDGYKAAESFKNLPKNEYFNAGKLPEFPNPIKTSDVDYTKVGRVYGANPSGTTLAHNVTWAAPINDAVWQFLFNPEELQLSSGPEYNRAESWGVSDPVNSGQPLSWRMNRNRKLTFGKVLLHGYSFGKRVDSLEKGLQDLFMAREGEGSDGPPVLEFVWGKRVFGPCVIQNIQVREKAWDKGILVNAEVSFELEQVPEWTINDGFVDVLRPGRQPTVNDPSIASENYRSTPSSAAPTGEDDPPGNKPGGGGEPPVLGDPVFCNKVLKYKLNIQKEFDSTGVILRRAALFDPGLNMETTEKSISDKYYDKFSQFSADPNISNPTAKSYLNFTFNYINTRAPGCTRKEYPSTRKNILGSSPGRGERIRSVQFINGCLKLISESRNEWIKKESKGGGFCAPLVSSRQAAEKTSQENKKCEKYKAAVSSSSGQPQFAKCSRGEAGTRATCGNVSYHCVRSSAKSNDWIWIDRN